MDSVRHSRRDLLAAGVSSVAASLMSGSAAFGAEREKPIPRVGKGEPVPAVLKTAIAAYSFREDLDKPGQPGKMSLFDVVDLCARLGVDAVEPTSYYFLDTTDAFINKLKRRAYLAGLDICGSPTRNNFCMAPGPDQDKEIQHVKDWVDVCVKLGAPAIRVFAGGPVKGVSREQSFEYAVPAMKKAAEYAGSKGVFLGLENHGYLTETADDLLKLVDAVGHDWLGINLDTGNFQSENPYEDIARCAPRAITCQFKIQIGNRKTNSQKPADFNRLAGIMREAGYRGYIALEYEGKDPHNEVPKYIAEMQKAFQA